MDANEQEIMIKDLEHSIERLHALYNQYFMGIEKLEPTIPKKEVERKINNLRKVQFSSTVFKFRFQTQIQKFNTHRTYWTRICRQIEEGTYERDLKRAKQRVQKIDEAEMARQALDQLGDDNTRDEMPAALDLGDMFSELDDAFDSGQSIADQMEAAGRQALKSVDKAQKEYRPPVKDSVHPVGIDDDAVQNRRQSGIKIPLSSLIASKKTAEARNDNESLGSFFKKPSIAPPVPPSSVKTDRRPPPPPRNSKAPSVKPPPPSRAAAPRRSQQKTAAGGLNDDKIKSVYRAYVAARKKTNEGADNISLNKVAAMLRKTDKAKGGVSDFKVVIRNGKAVIKTVK